MSDLFGVREGRFDVSKLYDSRGFSWPNNLHDFLRGLLLRCSVLALVFPLASAVGFPIDLPPWNADGIGSELLTMMAGATPI
jgi:hypothetical protein